jgi:hypothetical protein
MAQGMSKEDYQQWKDHPLTKAFHQYLRDYRQALMEKWAQGALAPSSPESLMAVARCQMADEIATLEDDSIAEFYRNSQVKEGAN